MSDPGPAVADQSSDERPGDELPGPWERWGWLYSGFWLVFLAYPVISLLHSDASRLAVVVGLVAVAVFGVVYVLGFVFLEDWRTLGLLMLSVAATVPAIGWEAMSFTPFVAVAAVLLLPSPWWAVIGALVAATPLMSFVLDTGFPLFFFLILWPITLSMGLVRLLTEAGERDRATQAELAVLAERERMARDVHDVVGHSLTVLSVKAELAARLIDLDPARARAELESIQATARQALAEVRMTVGGVWSANLATELAAAPRVLADAGVEATVVGEVADIDPRHRILLAWVLRECVTNVVRHAGASRVSIALAPEGLTVIDDGRGWSGSDGNGLRGMRERVAAAGGTLSVASDGPGTGTRVEARFG